MRNEKALKALAMLGLTPEDIAAADVELQEKRELDKSIDRQICICGHAMARHTVSAGATYCKPARMECPCKRPRPVLETTDTRMFIRKTSGGGSSHALARGIMAAAEKNKSVEWIVPLVCDRCGVESGNIVPVPVTQTGAAMPRATGFDVLLCPNCRLEV